MLIGYESGRGLYYDLLQGLRWFWKDNNMDDNNWSKWGEDIRRTVQSSIDSRDFSDLNENIGRIVDSAIKNVNDSLKTANRAVNDGFQTANRAVNDSIKNAGRASRDRARDRMRYSDDTSGSRGRERSQTTNCSVVKREKPMIPKLYGETASTTGIGVVLSVFGFLGILGTSGGMAATLIASLFGLGIHRIGGIISLVLLTALLGVSLFMFVKGISMIGRVNRFHRYVKELGNRMYCSIQEMAKRTGKSISYVQKDMRYMIGKGFFRQGHLDEQETYLMISDESYHQYQQAQQQYLLREQEKKRKERADAALPDNVRQVITEGEAFVRRIHASNDAIPGEEISEKIARMENIVQKIFQRVKEKPELVGDLKKLMSYYLPTTVKLLDAYEELDAQPIEGTNIASSKEEIEKTIDTLNFAFEKLLDDFYQDTAWDISSDISVLNTMLTQEGLTKSDFEYK